MTKINEQLKKWTGNFGKEYTSRNSFTVSGLDKLYKNNFGVTRTKMNSSFLGTLDRKIKILEVGSNMGNQLVCLQKMGFRNLFGIEPQEFAVEASKKNTQNIYVIKATAFDIPFKDNYFDLVFTSGVLIHINPRDIKKALKEIYRCAKTYIWGFEYFAKKYTEIPYRGNRNLLWKNDFCRLYLDMFPDLKPVKIDFFKYLQDDNRDAMFLLKKRNG